jgi:hypothetical protein
VPPIDKQKNYKCSLFNCYKLFLKGKPMRAPKKTKKRKKEKRVDIYNLKEIVAIAHNQKVSSH